GRFELCLAGGAVAEAQQPLAGERWWVLGLGDAEGPAPFRYVVFDGQLEARVASRQHRAVCHHVGVVLVLALKHQRSRVSVPVGASCSVSGYVMRPSSTRANEVRACGCERPAPIRCVTAIPRTVSASETSERWQRHGTASEHMIAVRLPP